MNDLTGHMMDVRIAAMEILAENVELLNQQRDACLQQLYGPEGDIEEKPARLLLATLDCLRHHAETSVKLRERLYTVEARQAFEQEVLGAVRSAEPEVADRIRNAINAMRARIRATPTRVEEPEEEEEEEEPAEQLMT